jgi:hypothetical protein
MTLNSYEDVKNHLNNILTANGQLNDTKHAPHHDWWNNMTYEQFTTGNVPGVSDPDTGQPMPILVVGNSSKSNIILALQGAPNTPFDPNSGSIGQMPADGPPFFDPATQIQPLADWIDAGCPNGDQVHFAKGGGRPEVY